LDAISPGGSKDCLVQQQLVFDRQLRFESSSLLYSFLKLPSREVINRAILQARVPLSSAGRTNFEPFGAMFVAPTVPY